jgi:hypothetical protein
VHNFFKKNFKFLATDTVEHSDGVQKCIRVRLGSGAGGGRGGGGRGGTWVVQGGEMTDPLIAEARAIGRIMLGSS